MFAVCFRIRVIANINHSVDIDEVDEMEGIDESARSEEMQHDVGY
jgi:hypothetical protein